ncbi:hypothetical protein V8C86DRAFT_2529077 [Haematococcus lacustris]
MPRDTVVARFTSFGQNDPGRPSGEKLHANKRVPAITPQVLLAVEHFPPLPVSTPRPSFDKLRPSLDKAHHPHATANGSRSSQESSRRGASFSDGTTADAPDGNIYVKDQHSQLHHPRHHESKGQASGKPPVHVAKDTVCQPKQDLPACTESLQLSALTLEIQQLNAKAAQRMALMHSTAKELLATVQRQGYEVASGLDALQDDLCEVEGLMLDSRRFSGALAEAPAAPVCTTLTLQRTHSPGSVSCALHSSLWPRVPKASAPIATAGSSGMHTPRPCSSLERGLSVCTPLSVSPNTERMVMLKARREHVEASFLELIKACVGGLERLVTLSDPAAAASTTVTSGGKPSQA